MLRRPAPAAVTDRVRALFAGEAFPAPGWLPKAPAAAEDEQAPALVTAPVSLRAARYQVSWRAVVAASLVVVGAALVFAVRVARATQSAAPTPVPALTSEPPGRTAPALGSATTTTATMIVVHVVGQVARPGVITLPEGSRVLDALSHAGGALPEADLARVNLARVVVDGEQLYVPRPGEEVPVALGAQPNAPGGSGGSAGTGPAAIVDLNRADLAALEGLPGVGPVLAQRILDWRAEHRRFSAVEELAEVSGIGERLLAQLRPRVRV